MRRTIIWLALLAAVLGPAVAVVTWWRNHYLAQARTHKVGAGDILSGVIVSGSIRSRQRTAVASEIIAAVQGVAVREGQEISAGEVLIEMDGGVVESELAKSVASVEIAEQRLAQLKSGARTEEIDRAQEVVRRAEANLVYTRRDYQRVSKAAETGTATPSELDEAANRQAGAEADLGVAQASLALVKAGARAEEIAGAEAEVHLAKAEQKRLEALLAKYTLRAPHAGIVTVKYVHDGEVVAPGEVLLRIDSVRDLEVRAQVQESQLAGVRIGGPARVLADAHPDTPLTAVVERILPRVDPEQGAITVLLGLVDPPDVDLMDNMAADIALIGEEVKGAVRVPAEAVEGKGKAAAVWVRQGGSFVRRRVNAGVSDGHWVQIASGLKPGEVVRLP